MAINMPKEESFTFLQFRFEPSVLVNDDICLRRSVYRAILDVLKAIRHDVEVSPGRSIVETVFDALFGLTEIKMLTRRQIVFFKLTSKACRRGLQHRLTLLLKGELH